MATSERFLPWSRETIFKHSPALARLLEYSFQPGSPETALDCPSLTATHASLLECSPCKICQLVYSLASDPDCEVGFFEDYACLCFYCLYAPLTWTSTFMAAADFLELTARYHPGAPGAGGQPPHFYGPEGIMAVDVQLHFLVKRCFKPVAPSELLGVSNLHFLKSEFLKGALTGSLSGLFCFKSVWGSLHGTSPRQQASFSAASSPATSMGGQCRCNPLASASAPSSSASRGSKNKKQQQQEQSANRPPPERQRPVLRESGEGGEGEGGEGPGCARGPAAGAFAEAFPPRQPRKPEILSVFLDAWAPSELLSEANRELAASGGAPSRPRFELPYPESADACQGPCLLSHALQLKRRNKTASVCVLCECLAGHGEAAGALARLREDVLTFVENNVQLVDRIAFVKRQPDFLVYVRDPLLRDAVRGCSEQEIHKHLFCDPLCALNAASACPDILFGTPREEKFRILKSSLALGHHLAENVFLDCEVLHTLVIIFKSIQLCKVGKTTFLEIIKELNQQLKSHNLHTLHTFHTATIYC